MIQSFAGHHPQLHASVWVHETAVVIGEVILEQDVTVWPTVVLRGDVGLLHIGASSNLQDGVIVHATSGRSTTRIGQRVTVGHRAVLHGCTVEDDCLIGMGAMILDNARVGAGCFIGAGALVSPGMVVPPHSLVLGLPGRVVRTVGDAEVTTIAQSWEHYVKLGLRYRSARTV